MGMVSDMLGIFGEMVGIVSNIVWRLSVTLLEWLNLATMVSKEVYVLYLYYTILTQYKK